MIDRLINEINIALNNGLYLSALISALTLPDVCGKAEFPNAKIGERYTKWYDEHVKDGDLPSETVYRLRCDLLHEGSVEMRDRDQVKFKLMTNQFTQQIGLDFCFDVSITHADGSNDHTVKIYVGYLCTAICRAAQSYYQSNKGKFSFLNYEIEELSSAFKLKR